MADSTWKLRHVAGLGFSILAVTVACGGASVGSSNSNSATSSSNPASATASPNNEKVVTNAIQAQNNLKDLTLTTQSDTTQGARSYTTQAKVEWTANPERFYAKATDSLNNRQTEMIIDTPTQATYVKSGANWIKTPAGSGTVSLGSGFLPALKGEAFRGFTVVGQESVEDKQTWHLSGPMPFTSGASTSTTVPNTTGTLDVWVGQSDYRLVKQVENLKSSNGGGFSMRATVVVNSVNSGVSIELPQTQ